MALTKGVRQWFAEKDPMEPILEIIVRDKLLDVLFFNNLDQLVAGIGRSTINQGTPRSGKQSGSDQLLKLLQTAESSREESNR